MRLLAQLIFLLVLIGCFAPVSATYNVTLEEDSVVSQLLYNLVLDFPPFDFTMLGLDVHVTNLTCTHLTATYLTSFLIGVAQPLNPETPTVVLLNLTLHDMDLNCTGLYSYQTTPFTSDSGDMNMTISDGSVLSLLVSAHPNITALQPASPSVSPSVSPSQTPSPSASISFTSTPNASNTSTSSASISQTPTISPIAVNPSNSSSITPSISHTPTRSSLVAGAAQAAASRQISEKLAQVAAKEILSQLPLQVNEKNQLAVMDDSTTSEGSSLPYIELSVVNCTMNATITYLHTSSFTLNTLIPQIIEAVTPEIPGLVCDKMATIITELEPVLNGIIATVYQGFFVPDSDNPDFTFNEDGFLYAFLGASILFLLMIFFLLIIPTAIKLYQEHQRAKQGELEPLIDDFESTQPSAVVIPRKSHSALIMDKRLAWYWRYLLLLVLLYNVALFASATVSVASNVFVYLTIGENVITLPSLYSFMIVSSVVEMWEAGVWPLSLLIGITSGIWPYVKLVIMFFLLLIPPRFLTPTWRKRILRILDALGKWSLIDVYVLVLFIEAFRVSIPLGENISFDMAVTAEYAFFAYVLATIISLALTHVFLYIHDELEEPAIPENGKMEQLLNHNFRYGSLTFVATIFGKILVPVLIIITAAGVITGSFVYAFELDWSGSLLGNLLLATSGSTSKEFSVVSLLKDIPNTSFNNDSEAGIRTIQVCYAMFVLVIPLLHLFSLLVVWVTPLTMQMQRGGYIIVEILSAWAAMDVFIVALIVALLELQQFAEFLISEQCAGIDQILQTFFPGGTEKCFTVKATLQSGSWILVVAVIVLLCVGYSVMYICNKAIRERKESEIKHLQDTGSMSDFFEPDRSVSPVTKALVITLKTIMCIRFV